MTSAILKFLVDTISSFEKRLEDTMQFEFKKLQLTGNREMLRETIAEDLFFQRALKFMNNIFRKASRTGFV